MNSIPERFLYSVNAFNPIFGNFTTNSYIMHIGKREAINKIEPSFIFRDKCCWIVVLLNKKDKDSYLTNAIKSVLVL